mmetsp:Transcript_48088/g.139293  ORF Transcript_48088/g.139293 Transcript_48088/m.139293 type:complete len:215 (+) Transcript_48088:93-737(+)
MGILRNGVVLCLALLRGSPALAARARAPGAAGGAPAWACGLGERPQLLRAARPPSKAASPLRLHSARGGNSSSAEAVEAVDRGGLAAILEEDSADLLIVFYAPWCPHCRDFVMQDAAGDAAKAPLQLLSRELAAEHGPKVLKFDIEASKHPEDFVVNYVPRIFFKPRNGAHVAYEGSPDDLQSLKDWVLAGGPAASNSSDTVIVLSGVGSHRAK